jgi:hypothetical protein
MWLTLGKRGAAQQEYPALSMPFPSRMRMKAPLAHRSCDGEAGQRRSKFMFC